jgi:hypothetical protein
VNDPAHNTTLAPAQSVNTTRHRCYVCDAEQDVVVDQVVHKYGFAVVQCTPCSLAFTLRKCGFEPVELSTTYSSIRYLLRRQANLVAIKPVLLLAAYMAARVLNRPNKLVGAFRKSGAALVEGAH